MKSLSASATSESDNDEIVNGCDLPESSTTGYLHLTSDGAVLYRSNSAIGGFQFEVDGTTVNANGASGGDAGANGFTMTAGGNTVLGFSFSGGIIPAGDPSILLTLVRSNKS